MQSAKKTVINVKMTLVGLQLESQNSYLFIYNTFMKILYMFRALACSSSGGLRRKVYMYFFLNRCTRQSPAESDDIRGCIYTIAT